MSNIEYFESRLNRDMTDALGVEGEKFGTQTIWTTKNMFVAVELKTVGEVTTVEIVVTRDDVNGAGFMPISTLVFNEDVPGGAMVAAAAALVNAKYA